MFTYIITFYFMQWHIQNVYINLSNIAYLYSVYRITDDW